MQPAVLEDTRFRAELAHSTLLRLHQAQPRVAPVSPRKCYSGLKDLYGFLSGTDAVRVIVRWRAAAFRVRVW